MKISSYDNFIKNIDKSVKCFLIYGTDFGLINIRKDEIVKKFANEDSSIIKITSINLKENPSIVENEYNSVSLFSKKKIILIDFADSVLLKIIQRIFENSQNNENKNIILITSDSINSSSSFVKFAELKTNTFIASIGCYQCVSYFENDSNLIKKLIIEKLKNNNFTYDVKTLNYLVSLFGEDTNIALNEVEKLCLYKNDDKNLTISDIKACIQDTSKSDIDDFVNFVALLDFSEAFKKLQNLFLNGTNLLLIIRSLILYFLKLQLYKYKILNGENVLDLVSKEFFKQKSIMIKQLGILTFDNINEILAILIDLECNFKEKINYKKILN